MGAEKLNKKRSGALVGGIFLILAVPVCGIQVPVQAFFFLAWIYVILFLEANSYSWNELQEAMGMSDRIMVMKDHKFAAMLSRNCDFTEEKMMEVML